MANNTQTDDGPPSNGPFNLAPGSQYIAIVATTAVTWTLLVFWMRVFLRKKVNGPFGWDDAACAAATFFGIAFSALTLIEVSIGLGKGVGDNEDFEEMKSEFYLLLYIQNFLYFLASSFAQISVAALIGRIAKVRMHLIMAYGLAAISGICALISILLVAFACDFPAPWMIDDSLQCEIDRWHVWLGNGIITILIELFIVKTAVILV